jgi:uncharacterized protein
LQLLRALLGLAFEVLDLPLHRGYLLFLLPNPQVESCPGLLLCLVANGRQLSLHPVLDGQIDLAFGVVEVALLADKVGLSPLGVGQFGVPLLATRRKPVRYKLVDEKPKTFVLVFETNDELSQGLKNFASEQKLVSASFKAIGALSSVKLGWLNWETKKYEPSVSLDEQVELLSLIGDVASKDGEPQVHAHVVIVERDGTAHGGHLLQAHLRPTCELVLTESPAHLKKEFDPAAGIAQRE